jgi:hypothetical protein
MTTTVYDVDGKMVASDSRWSMPLDGLGFVNHVLYVDDTEFEKLANRAAFCVTFAGDLELISEWKEWLSADQIGIDMPRTEIGPCRSVSLVILHKGKNEILFDCGHKYPLLDTENGRMLAVFTGSGGVFASDCWVENGCAKTSVESASLKDPYTGGEVKYLAFSTEDHNLGQYCFDQKIVTDAILNRGKVMNTVGYGQIVDIKAFDKDGIISTAISSGALHATAPTGGDSTFKWTPERKDKLRSVFDELRAEEKALESI